MHGGYRDFSKEASVNAKKDFLKVFPPVTPLPFPCFRQALISQPHSLSSRNLFLARQAFISGSPVNL
jgi:hypothetical protein